jgi:hypothetical protein
MSDGYLGHLIVVCCLLIVPLSHAFYGGGSSNYNTQGYVSLVYDTTEYKYPYQIAGFGPNLGYGGKNVTTAQAHLFIMNPKMDSIEATLCNVSSLQRRGASVAASLMVAGWETVVHGARSGSAGGCRDALCLEHNRAPWR